MERTETTFKTGKKLPGIVQVAQKTDFKIGKTKRRIEKDERSFKNCKAT